MSIHYSRRNFLKQSTALFAGTAAVYLLSKNGYAAQTLLGNMEEGSTTGFSLPDLPYAYDALEPHIDRRTMEIHHKMHHKSYVDNLNKALYGLKNEASSLVDFSLKKIFEHITEFSPSIRNNAGGHYNHTLFWTLMRPEGGLQCQGALADAINTSFGSMAAFKQQFTAAALKHFGSGWAWLVMHKGVLLITTTANQDNPLMNDSSIETKGRPILALDVWEHAYYLKNQNKRADYINSWWQVINWESAETLYQEAK